MIAIISPAKTLDLSTTDISLASQPDFKSDIKALVSIMKKKSSSDIQKLMKVSENIAQLNEERYQNFSADFNVENSKQALLAFKGDVYKSMDVDNYSEEDLNFAQEHLRILSGLYGLLKPMDLIQPYRLEMGISLKNKKGKNLYEYWGTKISKALNELAQGEAIINLASQEYAKAVDKKSLKSRLINVNFKEHRDGKYKIIGIFAKQARGLMADYIIKNQITEPEKIKLFNVDGYEFSAPQSTENEWIFVR
ncbi:peroxide stress protein YaaA [Echinicola marina]|uniref:peroxide stress protein YaaA n=1 Tax=Echinicola marina TaxID=2859768 RepID=UPI001CF6780C|nr:peroxide stress protein YaaA [Echinicola marina]UCS93752.1 peroxide stress protein YaaA [Echinicola marina]